MTGAVEEVGEADKGVCHIHVEQENGCDERHPLDLQQNHQSMGSVVQTIQKTTGTFTDKLQLYGQHSMDPALWSREKICG